MNSNKIRQSLLKADKHNESIRGIGLILSTESDLINRGVNNISSIISYGANGLTMLGITPEQIKEIRKVLKDKGIYLPDESLNQANNQLIEDIDKLVQKNLNTIQRK